MLSERTVSPKSSYLVFQVYAILEKTKLRGKENMLVVVRGYGRREGVTIKQYHGGAFGGDNIILYPNYVAVTGVMHTLAFAELHMEKKLFCS